MPVSRRTALSALLAAGGAKHVTKLGDVVPPSIPGVATSPPAVPPGSSTGIVRAREVIVSGSNGGVFVYSGKPAAGNMIASITGSAGTDSYGNSYYAGLSSYSTLGGFPSAININGGGISFYQATSSIPPYDYNVLVGGLGQNATPQFQLVAYQSFQLESPGVNNTTLPQPPPAATPAAIIAALQAAGIFT
jgi:hypothetical protein